MLVMWPLENMKVMFHFVSFCKLYGNVSDKHFFKFSDSKKKSSFKKH